MKRIVLSQGLFALVDDEDFDRLNENKWSAAKNGGTFYAQRAITLDGGKRKTIKMHREILGVTETHVIVDHINHEGLDNQKNNIRITDASGNQRNRRSRKKKSNSPSKGVYAQGDKFRVFLCHKASKFYIGKYDTLEQALEAYEYADNNHKEAISKVVEDMFK